MQEYSWQDYLLCPIDLQEIKVKIYTIYMPFEISVIIPTSNWFGVSTAQSTKNGNASKFAIFLEYENPHSFFHFSFRATLFFPIMTALVYGDIDQGFH